MQRVANFFEERNRPLRYAKTTHVRVKVDESFDNRYQQSREKAIWMHCNIVISDLKCFKFNNNSNTRDNVSYFIIILLWLDSHGSHVAHAVTQQNNIQNMLYAIKETVTMCMWL